MTDLTKIRSRIESAQRDLAKAQGEEESLKSQIEDTMGRLRKTLGCKEGKEKATLEALGNEIREDAERLEELLDEAESMRDGEDDEE